MMAGEADVRLPGKGNSNSHGARPVHLIITMIKWIRTSSNSLVWQGVAARKDAAREKRFGETEDPLKKAFFDDMDKASGMGKKGKASDG